MAEAMDAGKILQAAIECEASDLYLTTGQNVFLRVQGELQRFANETVTKDFMQNLLSQLLDAAQKQVLQQKGDVDFSYSAYGRRYRGNAYVQRGCLAVALRLLPACIPSLAELRSPQVLQKFLQAEQGLLLVCGRTGSGKSTTLAAFLQAVNQQRAAHILTLEDPIEYLYTPEQCFISQREYRKDFSSFAQALKSALREAPDIILVGEIRDAETMRTAMMAADAGALVLGTLHSRSAAETMQRVAGMFPLAEQDAVCAQFAEVLLGIFSQRLLPKAGGGRVAMTEVLLNCPAVKSLLRQGKVGQLESVMLSHQQDGMQTTLGALDKLFQEQQITQATWEQVRQNLRSGGRL